MIIFSLVFGAMHRPSPQNHAAPSCVTPSALPQRSFTSTCSMSVIGHPSGGAATASHEPRTRSTRCTRIGRAYGRHGSRNDGLPAHEPPPCCPVPPARLTVVGVESFARTPSKSNAPTTSRGENLLVEG